MKQIRYFLLTPMVVLAIVACAKRDSDFAKRAAEAKEAANKTAPGKDPKTSLSPSPNPSVSPAEPADSVADNEEESRNDQDGTADLYKESCNNPISMEAKEGETVLTVEELLNKDKQAYVLQSSEFYVEQTAKASKEESAAKHQLHVTGSHYALPQDFKAKATASNKMVVVCHTVKADEASTQKMSHGYILPYEISAADGAIAVLRQDKTDIDNKANIKNVSTLYSQAYNVKHLLADTQQVTKSLILKQADGTIVIKLHIKNVIEKSEETSGAVTNAFVSGVYALKETAK